MSKYNGLQLQALFLAHLETVVKFALQDASVKNQLFKICADFGSEKKHR